MALSGGGSRAIAFHLGCLRALKELGLLDRVSVLSTVSGGSVIGAAYSLHNGSFEDFEAQMRELLRRGLVRPALKALFSPLGLKVIAAFVAASAAATLIFLATRITSLLLKILSPGQAIDLSQIRSPIHRFASRASLLEAALDDLLFVGASLSDFRADKPATIINATELRTGSAFRFSARESGGWRCGRLARNQIRVAHAVAASAAYPLALPAFDETLEFERNGVARSERVLLSDGGVYDNLGLGPLWPDRSPDISLNVVNVDMIICCSAGYGLRHDPPSQFLFARMNSVFSTTFERAQNASISKLHELRNSGKISHMLFPYLGQQDSKLPLVPENLVRREVAHAYPTNFDAMPDEWIERLSLRGYQLTTCLARAYTAEVIQKFNGST